MSKYRLPYEEVEKECDDDLFIEVSQHMDDYIKVGEGLHLTNKVLDNISQTENGDVERKIAILWAWKRINGSTATAINLIKAFLEMGDLNMAEVILKRARSLQHMMFHLAPEKAKTRYPNWAGMTESKQEAVRYKLIDENRDVREAYAVFVANLMDSFIKRGVDPRVIQTLVNSFVPLEGGHDHSVVFNFSKDDSVSQVFCELSKHNTWFNYELFNVLVKSLGNDYERQYLSTYEDDHLIPYLNRSIFEIPCAYFHGESQRTMLILKVSTDLVLTGSEVKSIQRKLAKLLGFQNSAYLRFESYNEGCIELVFSLPTALVNECFSKSTLFKYLVWEPSRNFFKVDVDVITLL